MKALMSGVALTHPHAYTVSQFVWDRLADKHFDSFDLGNSTARCRGNRSSFWWNLRFSECEAGRERASGKNSQGDIGKTGRRSGESIPSEPFARDNCSLCRHDV